MFKKKTALLISALASAIILTGCAASNHRSSSGYDASRVDPYVTLERTTVQDVRALLGTPTFKGKTADGSLVYGFALVGNNYGQSMGRNSLKGLAMGFAVKDNEYTVKILLFKFDAEGRVVDFRKAGRSYMSNHRMSMWNTCERDLTPSEINSPVNYAYADICKVYAEEVAAKTGVKVEDVDVEREFDFCPYDCQTERSAEKVFGPLTDGTIHVSREAGDGARFEELFPNAK